METLPTIAELEALLDGPERDICINPDGSLTATEKQREIARELALAEKAGCTLKDTAMGLESRFDGTLGPCPEPKPGPGKQDEPPGKQDEPPCTCKLAACIAVNRRLVEDVTKLLVSLNDRCQL